MQRIDATGAVAIRPSADAQVETPGYFTEGTPGVEPATEVDAHWLNMVQEEIMSVVEDLGLTADKTKSNQMLQAIRVGAGEIRNVGLAASVSSNALTIALKDRDGNNPSADSQAIIPFRNATLATGTYHTRKVASSLSVVISSGSTLGTVNGVEALLFVYAIDNGGTVELAVSRMILDEGKRWSTTAEGGGGAADSNALLYSTTARSNVAIRLIGRIAVTQATAGTWASGVSEIAVGEFTRPLIKACYERGTTQNVADSSDVVVDYATKVYDPFNCVTTGGSWKFTAPKAGTYRVSASYEHSSNTWATNHRVTMRLGKNGSVVRALERRYGNGVNIVLGVAGTIDIELAAGDYINIYANQDSGGGQFIGNDSTFNWICITELATN